ncbi:hypothetical protein EMCRGX_G028676 [Ephydatia muelleri]
MPKKDSGTPFRVNPSFNCTTDADSICEEIHDAFEGIHVEMLQHRVSLGQVLTKYHKLNDPSETQQIESLVSLNVTTDLYQNNVYDVELFWAHRQQSISGANVSYYNVSVACVPTPVLQVGQSNVSRNTAVIMCTFLDGSSHYCMVWSSTDPSVPPDSSVYNISTTRGTEVTVSLQGLTSGQMYYCKAAATNTNSNNCAGPVVGDLFNSINIYM